MPGLCLTNGGTCSYFLFLFRKHALTSYKILILLQNLVFAHI